MSEYKSPIAEVTVKGRIAITPEVKRVGTTKLLELKIPIDTRKKNKESGEYETTATTWYAVKAWGDKAAEIEEMGLKKGDTVAVSGRLEQSTWKDKTGAERQSFEVAWPAIEIIKKAQSDSDDEI